MVKYCEECKHAKQSKTLPMKVCTNKNVPSWFNVLIYHGRIACGEFEYNERRKESSEELQIKQLFEAMFTV